MVNHMIQSVAEKLSCLPFIEGVVLGGSRARGTHEEDSDIDIGIYYNAELFDLNAMNQVAAELDDERRSNLVFPPGAWGKWVNGGGWLVINGYHVDFILRDIKTCGTNHQRNRARNGHCRLSDWASPWLYQCHVSGGIGDQQNTICER